MSNSRYKSPLTEGSLLKGIPTLLNLIPSFETNLRDLWETTSTTLTVNLRLSSVVSVAWKPVKA